MGRGPARAVGGVARVRHQLGRQADADAGGRVDHHAPAEFVLVRLAAAIRSARSDGVSTPVTLALCALLEILDRRGHRIVAAGCNRPTTAARPGFSGARRAELPTVRRARARRRVFSARQVWPRRPCRLPVWARPALRSRPSAQRASARQAWPPRSSLWPAWLGGFGFGRFGFGGFGLGRRLVPDVLFAPAWPRQASGRE